MPLLPLRPVLADHQDHAGAFSKPTTRRARELGALEPQQEPPGFLIHGGRIAEIAGASVARGSAGYLVRSAFSSDSSTAIRRSRSASASFTSSASSRCGMCWGQFASQATTRMTMARSGRAR